MKGLNVVDRHDETDEAATPEERQAKAGSGIIGRVLDGIAWLCMLIAGLALVIIIVTFGWLVYGRYVLDNTPTWVEQLSLLLVSYITFLGAAVGVRRNSHLSIDFVREGLPFVPRVVMRYLSDLLMIVFGLFMAWQGWQLFSTNLDRTIPMLGIDEGWRAMPMAICGVLMVVFSTYNIVMRAANGGDAEG